MEKLNYYKFIIKNTNHDALTANNSLVANKSINKNPSKCLLTNYSKFDYDGNINNTNKYANLKTLDFYNDINEINSQVKILKEYLLNFFLLFKIKFIDSFDNK